MTCNRLYAAIGVFFMGFLAAFAAQASPVPLNASSASLAVKLQNATSVAPVFVGPLPAPLAPTEAALELKGSSLAPSLALSVSDLPPVAQDGEKKIILVQRLVEAGNDMAQHSLEAAVTAEKTVEGWQQKGVASWYGPGFHGRKTASGERYDMNEMTAAHRTLPIPSYAKVTNLANGKEVIVRINDRGPFHSNRVMDVSYGAAKKLGMVNSGTARVRVEQLVPGQLAQADTAQPMFVSLQKFDQVQDAQAYLQRVNALVSKEQHGKKVNMVREGDKYVVQVGPFQSHEKTEPIKKTMLTAL